MAAIIHAVRTLRRMPLPLPHRGADGGEARHNGTLAMARRHVLPLLCLLVTMNSASQAADTPAPNDPYLWLEDVTGEKALAWVKEQNALSVAELAASDAFKSLDGRFLEILDSDARIPYVERLGDLYYNFWRDAAHERGIWRRTSLAEYRKLETAW
jgi:prolyl oligopeptidase